MECVCTTSTTTSNGGKLTRTCGCGGLIRSKSSPHCGLPWQGNPPTRLARPPMPVRVSIANPKQSGGWLWVNGVRPQCVAPPTHGWQGDTHEWQGEEGVHDNDPLEGAEGNSRQHHQPTKKSKSTRYPGNVVNIPHKHKNRNFGFNRPCGGASAKRTGEHPTQNIRPEVSSLTGHVEELVLSGLVNIPHKHKNRSFFNRPCGGAKRTYVLTHT